MPHPRSFLVLFSCLLLGLEAPAQAPRPALPLVSSSLGFFQTCSGCLGAGGSAGSSGGSCGGMVSIGIEVEKGQCKWFLTPDQGRLACHQQKGCKPTVMRSWSGLGGSDTLDFCITINGVQYCLDPKPDSGGGTDSDSRSSADMACSGEPISFSVGAPACGLFASAQATCSACRGLF